jgi:hypothetical protein
MSSSGHILVPLPPETAPAKSQAVAASAALTSAQSPKDNICKRQSKSMVSVEFSLKYEKKMKDPDQKIMLVVHCP